MKPRLQASLGQNLVMTPQLQQAVRLLQLSATELEAELVEALETNPLLEWAEPDGAAEADTPREEAAQPGIEVEVVDSWETGAGEAWADQASAVPDGDDMRLAEQVAEDETLHDHLLWQLHLSHLSQRDRAIGAAIIEAISDDGYLREPLDAIAASLEPPVPDEAEMLAVLHRIQHFDPVGVGARTLAESMTVQLGVLDGDVPGRALALRIAAGCLERLPRLGAAGVAAELGTTEAEAATAIDLLRSLDPRPGASIGALGNDAYITPDVVIWRQRGTWQVALANPGRPRLRINHGYESMIGRASPGDASYLRSHLQEARWLIRNLEARGETLLRVTRFLVQRQSAFLSQGDEGLRPLTLREVAAELGLHESTISRAVAGKHARTPRGTLPLRAFFASGVGDGQGEDTSSTAVQAMIRQLVSEENPRKPLSDAKLTDMLRAAGVPVARRTVAKYREAAGIPSSHERVRMG